MTINVPINVGDTVIINGIEFLVRGVHVYIDKTGCVINLRIHIGYGEFITFEVKKQ